MVEVEGYVKFGRVDCKIFDNEYFEKSTIKFRSDGCVGSTGVSRVSKSWKELCVETEQKGECECLEAGCEAERVLELGEEVKVCVVDCEEELKECVSEKL